MLCAKKILTVIAHCVKKRQRLVIWRSGLSWSLEIESVDVLGLEAPRGAVAPMQTWDCVLLIESTFLFWLAFYSQALSLANYLLAHSHVWITFSIHTVTDTGFPIRCDALLWWTWAIIVMGNGNCPNWIIQNGLQNVLREMRRFAFISVEQHESLRGLLVLSAT